MDGAASHAFSVGPEKRNVLMRCPKCGYISFDNVETCLRCNKDISETANAFQGSTLNVPTPVFLKFAALEDDGEMSLDGEDGDEIEFADPDLEILVDEGESEDDAEMDFAFADDQEDETAAAQALDEEFGSAEPEDESQQFTEGALDLGMFEDTSDEETFAFEDSEPDDTPPPPNMEIPEELSDISDLSPPDQARAATPPPLTGDETPAAFAEEPEPAASEEPAPLPAEPADDLDFSNMDMDFDLGEEEPALAEEVSPAAEKATRPASRMDDDLNFELDLGGLSIHDEK
jgi:hypothetical protein